MDDDIKSVESTSDHPPASYNAGVVGWVYRGISMIGMLMALGGVAVEIYQFGEVRRGLWPVHELGPALMAGEPSAFTTLGIMVLLAGPMLALISMFFSGIRRRSWAAVVLSGVVFLIILLAIPIRTWIEGGL
jgi:uncharacterized membrane protein